MTDPSTALASFQRDLSAGRLPLQRGKLNPDVFVVLDTPAGRARFTYLTVDDERITALVMLALADPIGGEPCFQLGVAVPQGYRREGRAKMAVSAAVAELQHGLAKNNITTFHVEAVVSVENTASQKVAAACISEVPVAITDRVSGLPALHYVKEFGMSSSDRQESDSIDEKA